MSKQILVYLNYYIRSTSLLPIGECNHSLSGRKLQNLEFFYVHPFIPYHPPNGIYIFNGNTMLQMNIMSRLQRPDLHDAQVTNIQHGKGYTLSFSEGILSCHTQVHHAPKTEEAREFLILFNNSDIYVKYHSNKQIPSKL